MSIIKLGFNRLQSFLSEKMTQDRSLSPTSRAFPWIPWPSLIKFIRVYLCPSLQYSSKHVFFSRANKQRSVGATNLNRASSRSHAVLTIEVTMPDEATGRSKFMHHISFLHVLLV
jgi:hypothetical protein